ncbi:immune-associated nucleotide-binding protein 7 [Plakobranchus ocellatus]|uniref:Immune-associated nucleotide-binding protein 7 n=1 Tax=Plakobranchus ocellatus TaxID=259542 RepID=A0AAV3ZTM4_9GAST|nr:immune-associated nucleotide-binding protein 7 [Plakobranchus ocellatus]
MSIRDGIGYHAFLLILKYSGRLTQEELAGIDTIKKIFGEDVFRKHGIIIMTGGDTYEREATVTFQDWCGQQTGPFKNLMDDCAGRILLFDNFTEDEAKITTMRDSLLECVDSLPSNGERYTNVLFKASAKEREIAIAASGIAVDSDELLLDTSLLLDEFEKCKTLEGYPEGDKREEQLKAWRRLLRRCKALNGEDKEQKKKSKLEIQIPVLQETLLNFIVAKENESQDIDECYTAMTKTFEELKTAYREAKASSIAIITGKIAACVTVFLGLVAAMMCMILYPPSIRVFLRIGARIITNLGFQLFKEMCKYFKQLHDHKL